MMWPRSGSDELEHLGGPNPASSSLPLHHLRPICSLSGRQQNVSTEVKIPLRAQEVSNIRKCWVYENKLVVLSPSLHETHSFTVLPVQKWYSDCKLWTMKQKAHRGPLSIYFYHLPLQFETDPILLSLTCWSSSSQKSCRFTNRFSTPYPQP